MRNTRLQVLQMGSGIVIAVLLGIHMIVSHLSKITGTTDPTTWESMINRARQGTWAALYIALLAFGIFHGLYGLRGIILETSPSTTTMRTINWIFIVVGIVVFLGASYVPIALLSK